MSVVLDEPGIRVVAERCTREAVDGPRDVVGPFAYELCLVREGCFHLRSRRIDVLADSVTALLGAPLEEAEISHPVPGGDATTLVFLSEQVVAGLGGGTAGVASGAHLTTPNIDLLHRQLAQAAAGAGHRREVEELALRLFTSVMAQTRTGEGRPRTSQYEACAAGTGVRRPRCAGARHRPGVARDGASARMLAAPPEPTVPGTHWDHAEPLPISATGGPGAGTARDGRRHPRGDRRSLRLR